jgi:hypothetical protein
MHTRRREQGNSTERKTTDEALHEIRFYQSQHDPFPFHPLQLRKIAVQGFTPAERKVS